MQNNISEHNHIVFFLLCEHVSFIPDNIVQCCQTISIPRPTAAAYKRCMQTPKKMPALPSIENIKVLKGVDLPLNYADKILDNIIEFVLTIEKFKYITLRELLYDILIYDINVHESIWHILSRLIQDGHISPEDTTDVLMKTHSFFRYYNNNYRPIYHMELYVIYLIQKIHKDHKLLKR